MTTMPASRPQITALSRDRRVLSLSPIEAEARIEVSLRGEHLAFSRSLDETTGVAQIVFERPLGEWEALDGSAEVTVNGAAVRLTEELTYAERRRLRRLIESQAGVAPARPLPVPESPSRHGVVPAGGEVVRPSRVPLPVGSVSPDGSAVVGRGGHLFIRGGSNSLIDRYRIPQTEDQRAALEREVEGWREVVERRRSEVVDLGMRFLQTFVPDKSTMLASGVDGLGPVTPALRLLEERLEGEAWFVSAREALARGAALRTGVSENWLQLDSHTKPRGAWRLSSALVGAFGDASFMAETEFEGRASSYVGDLGRRFFGHPIPERIETPSGRWLEQAERRRELVDRFAPSSGHAGRMMHWRSPNAPVDGKVLVFGNSFFGAGDIPISCNFWVSRAFREHKFVWSADMDLDLVKAEAPDLVICQTVERFMGKVPRR